MSYRDKAWYRPCIYDEPQPEAGAASGAVADSPDVVPQSLERRGGQSRDAVKPVGGRSLDPSPLVYRRARPDAVLDLDDNDEYEEPAPDEAQEVYD